MEIRNIGVWGTVMEGRVQPAQQAQRDAFLRDSPTDAERQEFTQAALNHAFKVAHAPHD